MLSPNAITIFRLISAPALLVLLFENLKTYALALFFVASWSDYIDGLYARHTKQTSAFGSFLDAFADKVLIITALTALLYFHMISGVHTIPAFIIIWREILIATVRHIPSNKSSYSNFNRLKTSSQMLACGAFFCAHQFPCIGTLAPYILWTSCILSVISIRKYWHKIKSIA